MLPGTPFPDRLSRRRHLGQVIGVHLADVGLRPRSILARSKLVLLHASLDTPGDVVGNLAHAVQQHVSVAQEDAVVMVVRMADLPEHLAVPVRFQDHPALERKAIQKALLRRAPVVEERPPLRETAGQPRWVRHVPGVDHVAVKVDEVHPSVSPDERSKKREPRRATLWIHCAQTNAPAFGRVLLHRSRRSLAAGLVLGHRTALHTWNSDSGPLGAWT